jgi:class III poly(R)-hydroxyalkanoic acid synthase PhaE subunit
MRPEGELEMDEPDPSQDWIRQWIAQQRALLQQRSAPYQAGHQAGSAELRQHVMDLGNRSLDLGQAYLGGLHQLANGAQPAAAISLAIQLAEDFIGAWRTQWQSLGESLGQSLANLKRATPDDSAGSWADVLSHLPPIGLGREHNAALRELGSSHAEYQRLEQAMCGMLFKVQTEALDLLERRVCERQAAQALTTFRELYDLWVECGELVYAQVAHSDAYCRLQAQFGNAAVRLRGCQQKLIEHALKQFDLPTRSELNSVHRQLREQARQLRELKELVDELQPAVAGERAPTRPRPQRSKGMP